jgi:archaellum component FlaC
MVEEKHLKKMPNPLGRRRVDTTPVEAKEEISKLKEELSDLRKLYLQDMANVSSDMRALVSQLSSQIETPPAEEPAVVDAPVKVVDPVVE